MLSSCTIKNSDIPVEAVYEKESQHLSLKDKNGNVYYFNSISNIFCYSSDTLIIIPEKDNKLFVTNNKLTIYDVHDLNEYGHILRQPTYGWALFGKDLFFHDITLRIKKYNIITRKMEVLKYSNIGNKELSVGSYNIFVGTENYIQKAREKEKGNILCVGYISKENDIKGIPLLVKYKDYGPIEYIKAETAYSSIFYDRIYVIFVISNKVLLYDLNGNYITTKELCVSDEYYKKPEIEYKNGKATYNITGLTMMPLQQYEGYLSHLMMEKDGSDVSLVLYD